MTLDEARKLVAKMLAREVEYALAEKRGWRLASRFMVTYGSTVAWRSPSGQFYDDCPAYCSDIEDAMALTEGPWWERECWMIQPSQHGTGAQVLDICLECTVTISEAPTTAEALARAALVGALTKEAGDGKAK